MDNNPNENGGVVGGTTVTPNIGANNVPNGGNVSQQTTVTPTVMATVTPVVAQQVVTPTVTPVTTTTTVTPVITTSTPVMQPMATPTIPVEKKGPVAPQQDRVQLINDKPKLHAIMGSDGKAIPTEEKKEVQTEVLENAGTGSQQNEPAPEPKGSKLRTFFLIVLFGGLFVMIIFLPDISSYIETQKYLRNQPVEEKITTGTLNCTLESSTTELDYSQTLDFSFANSSLTRLTYVTETRGDISLDEETLDTLKAECDELATYAEELDGITVSCQLLSGILTRKQTFNYSSIVVDKAMTAYVEAGGAYPDYENGESIDDIEKDMTAAGYTCERIKD